MKIAVRHRACNGSDPMMYVIAPGTTDNTVMVTWIINGNWHVQELYVHEIELRESERKFSVLS